MKNVKLIIFDFDGTIADTLSFGIKIANTLSTRYNYGLITNENIDLLRGKSAQDVIKASGIPFYKLPFVAVSFQKEFSKVISALEPFKGINETLTNLKKHFELGILTSNSIFNVNYFLEKNKLQDIFSFVISNKGLFGKSKLMKKIIKNKNLKNDEVIYIGDETRDIEAAHLSKIKVIAVSWGFNTKELLEKFSADYIVKSPFELENLLINMVI